MYKSLLLKLKTPLTLKLQHQVLWRHVHGIFHAWFLQFLLFGFPFYPCLVLLKSIGSLLYNFLFGFNDTSNYHVPDL